jgi:hypothetical protein
MFPGETGSTLGAIEHVSLRRAMLGIAWAQLRHRPLRALAPFFGVTAATAELASPEPAASALVAWVLLAVVAAEVLLLTQRPDLRVLARLGWPPGRVYGLVLLEFVLLAVPATALGMPLAWGVL